MRQQEDDKSVSYRAVFVEPLASNDGDGGRTWVMMPWAAVEEQLAARPEFCSINDSESETSVTCSRRVTGVSAWRRLVMWTLGRLRSSYFNFTIRQKSLCLVIWLVTQ